MNVDARPADFVVDRADQGPRNPPQLNHFPEAVADLQPERFSELVIHDRGHEENAPVIKRIGIFQDVFQGMAMLNFPDLALAAFHDNRASGKARIFQFKAATITPERNPSPTSRA